MPTSIRLSVQIKPNASRNQLVNFKNGVLTVRIAAPPVEGKANTRLIEFLSGILDIAKSNITIERGLTGKHKVLAISGITTDQLNERMLSKIK